MNVGAITGSILSGPLMVWLGQRVALLIALPIVLTMWLCQAFSPNVWTLQLSRALLGVAQGLMGGTANNFVVELAHSSIRGNLYSFIDIFRQLGSLYVFIVGCANLNWREISIVCSITTTIIPFIGLILVHNSPRWLAVQGRIEDARNALLFYRGKRMDINIELAGIKSQLDTTQTKTGAWDQFKMMFSKNNKKRMYILSVLMFGAFFTGNNIVTTYSTVIFEKIDPSINPFTSTVIIGTMRVVGTGSYAMISEKFGRRKLFLVPLVISSLSLGALAIFLYLETIGLTIPNTSWVPLTLLISFTISSCMALPVLMLYRSELLPNSVRALGSSLVYVLFFGGNFITSFSYPPMVNTIGLHGTFGFYSICTILIVIFGYIFLPETKGRSLEDIEKNFKSKKSNK